MLDKFSTKFTVCIYRQMFVCAHTLVFKQAFKLTQISLFVCVYVCLCIYTYKQTNQNKHNKLADIRNNERVVLKPINTCK